MRRARKGDCRPWSPTRSRSIRTEPTGFTLIELLIVIVILGLLVGLLVPAVMNAVRTAKSASASAEIQVLGQALASFKNDHGDYPPSRIVCVETGRYDSGVLGTNTPAARLAPRTLAAFRRFWPRMDLRTDGSTPTIPGGWYDFNGDGSIQTTPYILTGPECLVLFLGGVPQKLGSGAWAVTGFAKAPTNPFQAPEKAANRTPPYHTFVSSRLVSYKNGSGPPTDFPVFLDSIGSYDPNDGAIPAYVYFSSYGGSGYDPGDCDMAEKDSATGAGLSGGFVAPNAVASAAFASSPIANGIQSPAPNPYTASAPIPTNSSGAPAASAKPRVWQQPQTFQLISAGPDRVFGIGGQYDPSASAKLPWVDASLGGYKDDSYQAMQANAAATGVTLGLDARARERDNLTNFSQGKLD